MKTYNALSAVLACLASTLVAAWLLGSFIGYALDSLAPADEDVIAVASTPWFGNKPLEVRRLAPVTVIGHREAHARVAAAGRYAP